VIALEQLVTANKVLREAWSERRMPILVLIRDLAATPLCEFSDIFIDCSKLRLPKYHHQDPNLYLFVVNFS
jgi:hypothetical protein